MKAQTISLAFLIVIFLSMAACGSGQFPTLAIAPSPTFTPTPISMPTFTSTVTSTSTLTPTATPTLTPTEMKDVPIYKNSFEEITDLAASGITSSNASVKITTANVNYGSGNQALEVYGNLVGAKWSTLDLEFSIKKLTGEDFIDLTNKTINYSAFIPADSAIDNISVYAGEGEQFVFLAGITADAYWYKGGWHDYQFDLKNVPGLMKDCDTIRIVGQRLSDGVPTDRSFFVDDLKWIGVNDINHIPLDDNVDSIRKYANVNHMKIGSVVLYSPTQHWFEDPWYLQTLAQEFNLTVIGGSDQLPQSKPVDLATYNLDYSYNDQLAAFAEGNGLALKGITGGWHVLDPQWLLDANYDELKTFLERKVEQDVGRYKGKVLIWDVFNEVVDDTGNGLRNRQQKNPNDPNANPFAPYGYHYSPWVDGNDTSLIEAGFIKARAVDPDAKLFLNDFQNEEIGKEKSEFFYNFVTGMKNRGIPIDGVGFELHLIYPNLPWTSNLEDLDAYLDRVDQNIKRYAKAGLLVEFSEVECQIRLDDIDLATQAGRDEHARRVQKQADIYSGLMRLAKENSNVAASIIWAVSDKLPGTSAYSTSNAFYEFKYTDAYLFDKNHYPKPAYYGVLDVLKP